MAEQTPSGFIPLSKEPVDEVKKILKRRSVKVNSTLPVADNAARWSSDKDKQFTPQDVPKTIDSYPTDKVSKVKDYLLERRKSKGKSTDKAKYNRTKPETLPLEVGLSKNHVSTNPLKEFKYSFYDGKQVMR